jgi:transcription antitermination factor NusG
MREFQQAREGQIVRVIYGPFTGFLGEGTAAGQQTVNVTVQEFGRVTPVDLAFGQIELVPENSN